MWVTDRSQGVIKGLGSFGLCGRVSEVMVGAASCLRERSALL